MSVFDELRSGGAPAGLSFEERVNRGQEQWRTGVRSRQSQRLQSQKTRKKKKEEDTRGLFSKVYDQLNIADSGRSFKTATPSKKEAQKSVISQLGDTVGASYKRTGEAVGETINQFVSGDQQQREFQQGQSVLQGVIDRADQRLKDPNLDPTTRSRIKKLREETIKSRDRLFGQRSGRLTDVIEKTDPVKGAAAIGSIGFDVATLGTGAKAAQAGAAGLARNVASAAGQGAVSGGLGAIEQQGTDVSVADIARGAGIGAAVGGGLTAAAGGISSKASKYYQEYKTGKISKASEQFVKENPAAARILKQAADESRATTRERLTTTIHLPDKGVYARVTPEQANILRGEINKVKASSGDIVQLSADTPALRKNATEVSINEIANLSDNAKKTISNLEAPTPSVASAVDGGPRTGVSGVAQTTEARTIQNKLSEGFGDLPTYEKIDLADQANKTVNLINADYEAAKQIALGNKKPPEGILPTSVYKGVENQAIKDGDVSLLHQLATESKITSEATKAGQFNAALAQKDPESPLTAMQKVIKARKDSKLADIPKDLNPQEAQRITDLSKQVADAKAAIELGGDRMDYGRARVALDNYVNDLQAAASKKSFKDKLTQHPGDTLTELAGATKGIKAALDNSALFRQGWKTMFTNPVKWQKNARQSFVDIARELGGKNMLDELKADIISRPNSINGNYKRLGIDVADIAEEAFPNSLPEKIPVGGRLFKASEAAYTGFLQRMRADLADQYVDIANKTGVFDLATKKEAESVGKLINSLTGRGHLGSAEPAARVLNNFFFSPRNLKSNVDFLTAHQLQKGVTPFVRKEAAKNLAKTIGGIAGIMATANFLKPGSVEFDPRSSNFGKIKIGNTRFDISGGMSSIATIAARLATDTTKSSTTGRVSELNTGEFGGRTSWNVLQDFIDGKLSPIASTFKNWKEGKDFTGNKVTPASLATNLLVPLPVTNYQELKNDPKSANTLVAMMADALGIGTNTYSAQKDWNQSSAKRIQGFKQEVSPEEFAKANNEFNDAYNKWLEKVSKDKRYTSLPENVQKSLMTTKVQDLTDEILKKYDYEYKTQRRSDRQLETINELKGL